MKKLSTIGMVFLVFVLMSDNAISIEYNTNISPELTVEVGECFYMDIRLEGVPEALVTAGFFIVHDSSLASIVDVAVYDGELTPALWDSGFTYKVPDADGPGAYMLACGNFSLVSPEDVRIARAEICAIAEGVNTIIISTIRNSTIRDFQTVVSGVPDYEDYDPQIIPHVITVYHCNPDQDDDCPPQDNGVGNACDCEGDFNCDGDCDGTDALKFKVDFGRSTFDNPCESGDSCNGDFDCDEDCDGTDAAVFKLDFGRSSLNNPCPACTVEEWCNYPLP